jgi:hypothetical protein
MLPFLFSKESGNLGLYHCFIIAKGILLIASLHAPDMPEQ